MIPKDVSQMASELPTPLHIFLDSGYAKQDGWQLDDISHCPSGNIAVSGHNGRINQSYVSIYGSTVDNSDSRDKPTLLYHRHFTYKDDWPSLSWRPRCILFIKLNSTEIVTCRYDEVQVIDYIRNVVLRSRNVNAESCLSVSKSQIFIGLEYLDIINIYDNDLNEIKSFRFKGIRDGWPRDIAAADRLYVRTAVHSRAVVYSQGSGSIITQCITGQDRSKVYSIAVTIDLGLTAVLGLQGDIYTGQNQIIFYLPSENKSFLTVVAESGVSRIRVPDQGRIVTGNADTVDVKIYNLESLFSYSRLKESLVSRRGRDDFEKLANLFTLGGEVLNGILNIGRPASTHLLALEEKDVIRPSNVDRLEEAFRGLKTSPSFYHTLYMYQKLRDQITTYDKFLATISAHLTSSIAAELCDYFHVFDEQKNSIISSQNPELSSLLVLDGMGIMKPSEVRLSEEPFNKLRLVQAVAKIHHYQELLEEKKIQLSQNSFLSFEATLSVESTITNDGGLLKIAGTDVQLIVPPGAFKEDRSECLISMTIIPPGNHDEASTSFCSNSSTIVELLPNNLTFKHPVQVTLPHCLQLKKGAQNKVKIFMSHHEGDAQPRWEEVFDNWYLLDDKKCTIWIKRFCWIKYKIDGEIVEAKKIKIFTAAEPFNVPVYIAKIEVGYHLDLPGAGEFLRVNPSLIVGQRIPYLFLKEGHHPLKVFLIRTVPNTWTNAVPGRNLREIPFRHVASSLEYSCPFILTHDKATTTVPTCLFKASQNEKDVMLQIRLKVFKEEPVVTEVTRGVLQEGTMSGGEFRDDLEEIPVENVEGRNSQKEAVATQVTPYEWFLLTLSAHLTANVLENLCNYFGIIEEEKSNIASEKKPGLSLLMALDAEGVINWSNVTALMTPLTQFKLVQAAATVEEYGRQIKEGRMYIPIMSGLDVQGKRELFIQCLKQKIQSWYETMTPVPWKKSCKWKAADLFVGSGLILRSSKSKTGPSDIDSTSKLQYYDVLTHKILESESRLILEGEPGSGKTMLASQLAYDWSQSKFSDVKLLVFLPLKFVGEMTIAEAVKQFYVPENIPLREKDIDEILEKGNLETCIVLDGLEEYDSKVAEKEGKPSEVHEVISKNKYPTCKVIITARSDYAQDLPACKMLKLLRFEETERNTYIEKLFPGDEKKQKQLERMINDSPFILDLCSVPLLFVLVIHNFEGIDKYKDEKMEKVTPFMMSIDDTLCEQIVGSEGFENSKTSQNRFALEELAFTGLCRGSQKLSWQRNDVEVLIDNVNEWIDAGILIVEDDILVTVKGEVEPEDRSVPSSRGVLPQAGIHEKGERASQVQSSEESDSIEVGLAQRISGLTSKHVPSRLKFLHKLYQEWYAAKYLSFELWSSKEESFRDLLNSIDPIDLHYILRFTCYLCPPCCHLILTHLMKKYYKSTGGQRKAIMDCICLCFAEYNESKGHDIKQIVRDICKEDIVIQSQDSRLLQYAKTAVLKFASQSQIPITSLELRDVVTAVRGKILTLKQDVSIEVLDSLQCINVSRWDEKLSEEDYSNIVDLIAFSPSVKQAVLEFPFKPPKVDDVALLEVSSKEMRIEWKMGQVVSILNPEFGMWETFLKGHGSSKRDMSPLDRNTGSAENEKEKQPSTSSLLATSTPSFQLSVYQGTKEQKRSDSITQGAVTEKKAKFQGKQRGASSCDVAQSQSSGVNNATVADLHTEGFIDERGGTLTLQEADISLHVPAGALSRGCLIRLVVPMDLTSCLTGHQVSPRVTPLTICEPDDTLFNLPVQLTLPHCAVIKKPNNHDVHVKFGYRNDTSSKEMIWKSEKVECTLEEHYCSVFLHHFSGVDVNITSTEEKILRVIPYATLICNNELTLNVWLCNDLESDFQSVINCEEKNAGIPLESYDTFQLNCISGPATSKVTLCLEEMQSNKWDPLENEDAVHVERLANCSKSKTSFSLQRTDSEDGDDHIYLLLKVTQKVEKEEEERDTTFAIRKMMCDLRTPALFKRPCNQYKQRTNRLLPTEVEKRPFTAVVYMDPVKDLKDDAILTLWLSPFDSNSEEFQFLQEEQELQLKHIVDTENSFVIFGDKVVVASKTRSRKGKWSLSPKEKKIKTDRIRFGSRAKFQFIGRRKEQVDADHIDLEVELFQEDKCKIRFMKEVEMDDLRYEKRRQNVRVSTGSVSNDSSTFLISGAQSEKLPETVTQSLPTATSATVSEDSSSSQTEEKSVNLKKSLRPCFMFLKKKLVREWRDVGRYLDLPEEKLELLKEEHKDDVEERIYQMLLSWEKSSGSKATHEKLLEALKESDREDLAEKL